MKVYVGLAGIAAGLIVGLATARANGLPSLAGWISLAVIALIGAWLFS